MVNEVMGCGFRGSEVQEISGFGSKGPRGFRDLGIWL